MDAVPSTAAAQPGPPASLWSEIREALRGSHRDLTEAPLGRAIFVLAVPMVLEMVMESVFAVTDIFFVGRLGAEAQATVGLTETIETMVYALSFGLSIGATSLVARRMGEKDQEAAARTAVQAIALGLLFGIPLSAAGAYFAPDLLRAMGGSPWVLEHGVHFTRVLLGANVSVCLLFLINAIFRGAGDAATAMRALWLANGINIVLGPCLVFGVGPFPQMGVMGAAVATSIGRTSGVIYQLYRLTRGDGRLTVRWRHVRLEARTMLSVLRLSGSGTRTRRRRSSDRTSERRSQTGPSARRGKPEASARSSSAPSASSSSWQPRTSSASSPTIRWCSTTGFTACGSSPRASPSTRTA